MGYADRNTDSSNIPSKDVAEGFLNIYLPGVGGKLVQVGKSGIALRKENSGEMALATWAATATPEQLVALVSTMVVQYKSATKAEGSGGGFVLPV